MVVTGRTTVHMGEGAGVMARVACAALHPLIRWVTGISGTGKLCKCRSPPPTPIRAGWHRKGCVNTSRGNGRSHANSFGQQSCVRALQTNSNSAINASHPADSWAGIRGEQAGPNCSTTASRAGIAGSTLLLYVACPPAPPARPFDAGHSRATRPFGELAAASSWKTFPL